MKLVIFLICCFALAGCSSGTSINNTAGGTSSSSTPASGNTAIASNTPPKPPSLDEEAMKIGRKYFEDRLVQCGDSYYTKIENHNLPPAEAVSLRDYVQYRNVSFPLAVDPVSDINRMNGLEWSGRVSMNWTYMRTAFGFAKPLRWASWQPKGTHILFVKKNKSGWKLDERSFGGEKPTCQEVERIPESQ